MSALGVNIELDKSGSDSNYLLHLSKPILASLLNASFATYSKIGHSRLQLCLTAIQLRGDFTLLEKSPDCSQPLLCSQTRI
jgi:hypothetical protein